MEINGLPKDLKTWAIYHNAIKFGKRNSHEQIFTELILKYYIELKENDIQAVRTVLSKISLEKS